MCELYVQLIPRFVWVCFCVWLFLRELRMWAYVIIDSPSEEEEPMPESVRHMYS